MASNASGKDTVCCELNDFDDLGIEIDDAYAYDDEYNVPNEHYAIEVAGDQGDKHDQSDISGIVENSTKQSGFNTNTTSVEERNNVVKQNNVKATETIHHDKVKEKMSCQQDNTIAANHAIEHIKLNNIKSQRSEGQDKINDTKTLEMGQIIVEGQEYQKNKSLKARTTHFGVDNEHEALDLDSARMKEPEFLNTCTEVSNMHTAAMVQAKEELIEFQNCGKKEKRTTGRPVAKDHDRVENAARPSAMDSERDKHAARPSAIDSERDKHAPRPSGIESVHRSLVMDHVHVDEDRALARDNERGKNAARTTAMDSVHVENTSLSITKDHVRVEVLEWQDSKEEDEEVEGIMRSTEMLDRLQDQLKRRVKDQLCVEVQQYRNRSKSVDDGRFRHPIVDFAKYGISVGVNSANELLPGIEEFLCTVLAQESLSPGAEEQRQFFLERLDIIKMPPSVPPRPQSLGVNLFPVDPSQSPSNCDSIPSNRDSIPSLEQEDFAAYQRELSRALVETDAGASPQPEDDVKVYDDIDFVNISAEDGTTVVDESQAEDSMYEVPQLKRSLSDSGYEKAIDISPAPRSASTEKIPNPEEPPPLPPRQERSMSETTLRSSVGSILDERTQDLVYKATPGNQDQSVGTPATPGTAPDSRSMRSADDILTTDDNLDEADGMSCDSIDNVGSLERDSEMMEKLGIALPKPKLKKRKSTRRKLGLSLSALKESTMSFRALEDVVLSGELHYRSKLSWTRKLIALTNGRLVCYKADKPDTRPSHIVVLAGYQATYQKREGNKRGFEITLCHDMFEMYTFLADFKEWAEIWCEHLNAAAGGRKAPGPILHLARGSSISDHGENEYNLTRVSHGDSSSSNLSLASSDGFDFDPGTVKVKKRDVSGTRTKRMGSFAFRATQFFESIGKSSKLRKSSSTDVYRPHARTESQTSLTETSEPNTPQEGIEEERPIEITKHIKHQGFLDIYSSFNKRKWGKRWCMVHENNFECYRTQTSDVCELEFLLRNCVLRRAIQETKSELGLMLMENQREKLTIEPVNWTELGSWLRVLMQETSTQAVPDGLQAYVDASNPYHEPVEVTRLSDPFPVSPPAFTTGKEAEDDRHSSTPSRNRDSGNCSAESMFGSLERRSTDHKTHPSYNDSSLPRTRAGGTGDIYTQVRKTSKAGLTPENQTNSKNKPRSGSDVSADKFDYDFSATIPSMKPGESLMDEIMSQFKTQLSVSYEVDKDGNIFNFDNIPENQDSNTRQHRKSSNPTETLSAIENVVSPIKDQYSEAPVSNATENLLCSSFIDESSHNDQRELTTAVPNIEKKTGTRTMASHKDTCDRSRVDNTSIKAARRGSLDRDKAHREPERTHSVSDRSGKVEEEDVRRSHKKDNSTHGGQRRSSLGQDAESLQVTLEELRIKLVQLKKDRICIRDRKQKISSEINRAYLEAEFNRLNTECRKVQEEISYLEKLQISGVTELTHGGLGRIEAIPECDSDSDPGKQHVGPELEAGVETSQRDHGDNEDVPKFETSADSALVSNLGTTSMVSQRGPEEVESIPESETGGDPSHSILGKVKATPECELDHETCNDNVAELSDVDRKDMIAKCKATNSPHQSLDKRDFISKCETDVKKACDGSISCNTEPKVNAKSVIQAAIGMKMKQTKVTDKVEQPASAEQHKSTLQHTETGAIPETSENLNNLNSGMKVTAEINSKQQSTAVVGNDLQEDNGRSEVGVETEETTNSTDCTTPDSAIADCTPNTVTDCSAHTDNTDTDYPANTDNTETILESKEQLTDTYKDSHQIEADKEQSRFIEDHKEDINGTIQDLSSAFETKLTIHSSQSD